jgi:nucleotide-binding universal stress UspA family protein
MKRILVPCDFSKPAINAYRFALHIAAKSSGIIHLIYVIELPALHDSMLMPVISIEKNFMDDLRTKTEKKFIKLIEKYKSQGVKVKFEVIFGEVTRMIAD